MFNESFVFYRLVLILFFIFFLYLFLAFMYLFVYDCENFHILLENFNENSSTLPSPKNPPPPKKEKTMFLKLIETSFLKFKDSKRKFQKRFREIPGCY